MAEELKKAYDQARPKALLKGKKSEILKHLVEGLTSDKKGMIALGYDCLVEAVDFISPADQVKLIKKWDDYFANDPEFKDLQKGKVSANLKRIYEKEVKPRMM